MTVTALDDYTVECILPLPFAPFLRSMGTAIYPKHILEEHVDDGTFASTWDIDTDPAEVIGTGPFTIEATFRASGVVMRRNPDYWLKDDAGNSLPYLDEVVHVIVPDLEAELARFLAGESDYPTACWARSSQSLNRFRRKVTSRYTGEAPLSGPRSWDST